VNLAASVRQRLKNVSAARGRGFDETIHLFAMERFLYRLGASQYREAFVLKGALLFVAWHGDVARPTRDVDLLGQMGSQIEGISAALAAICAIEAPEDALSFELLEVEEIIQHGRYCGLRAQVRAHLERSRIPFHVDIGFGDPVVPSAVEAQYPTILPMPRPLVMTYSHESVVAEKLHAMVQHGLINSRLKDYHDLWLLSRGHNFEGRSLSDAIRATFERRQVPVPQVPVGLDEAYVTDESHAQQWRMIAASSHVPDIPSDLASVVQVLRQFLMPVIAAVAADTDFHAVWSCPGPWRET